MIPGMREIPDAQAEMNRLAALRSVGANLTVTIEAGKTAEFDARSGFAVTVRRHSGHTQVLSLSAGEYAQLCGLLRNGPQVDASITFEDDSL